MYNYNSAGNRNLHMDIFDFQEAWFTKKELLLKNENGDLEGGNSLDREMARLKHGLGLQQKDFPREGEELGAVSP